MAQITNEELLAISEGLNYLSSKETKIWFQVLKNKKKIKSKVDEVTELRKEIIEKFAKKDEEGKPSVDEKGNVFIDDVKSLNEALKKLSEEKIEIEFDTATVEDLEDSKLESRYLEPLMGSVII